MSVNRAVSTKTYQLVCYLVLLDPSWARNSNDLHRLTSREFGHANRNSCLRVARTTNRFYKYTSMYT